MTRPFFLHTDSQAVYIRKGDAPSEVLALPGVSTFAHEGDYVTAVPFTLAHCHHLRKAGFAVPSPIGYDYEWPKVRGLHAPFAHQKETAAFLTLNHRAFCLNGIGTMKTYSALWAADYLRKHGYVRKVLVLSPMSTLRPVWQNSVHDTFFMQRAIVLHAAAKRRRELFAKDFDYYIVNHDGLEILCDKTYDKKRRLIECTLQRDDIDLIIIDELAVYRNSSTTRWAVLNKVIKPHMWVWGLTGHPTPNAPSDAWAQIRLIQPSRVPQHFSVFRSMTMAQVSEYVWEPRKEAPQIVFNAMQPAIRYERDQCLDLPGEVRSVREVPMTAEQTKHFREVANDFVTLLSTGAKVTAQNEGVKRQKLLQISCGVVYDKNGAPVQLDVKPRLDALTEILDETPEKVIVFAPFTSVVDMIAKHLRKAGWSVEVVTGSVGRGERDRIFADFQGAVDPHVLVADPGTMSHGLTLTEAATIVWFGVEDSNDTYVQANGRITRPGQKHVANIIHLVSSSLERKIIRRQEERQRIEGTLLEMVKTGELLEIIE